ncbi:MAG: SapC family protein [Comamonadaceae bacterium]|nr:MAG: SapC family protein [Comamonadaceae bacterium]
MDTAIKPMIFYERPVIINREHHRDMRLGPPPDMRYAAGSNSFLMAATESVHAMRDYPVLFVGSPDGKFTMAVLTGLKTDENLFVSPEDGTWRAGTYVPAFVRRYPFVLVDAPEGQDMQIAGDASCAWLDLRGEHKDWPRLLQDNGENTREMDELAVFLVRFHEGMKESREFATHLHSLGLLVPRWIKVQNGKVTSSMENFFVVDEARLKALDPDVTKDLTVRGYMGWIHFHLASLENVQKLARMADERAAGSSAGTAGQPVTKNVKLAPAEPELPPIPQAPRPS